jgi:hypothetical protein
LFHLGRYDDAKKALKIGRDIIGESFYLDGEHLISSLGADREFDDCESYITKNWFTLGTSDNQIFS